VRWCRLALTCPSFPSYDGLPCFELQLLLLAAVVVAFALASLIYAVKLAVCSQLSAHVFAS